MKAAVPGDVLSGEQTEWHLYYQKHFPKVLRYIQRLVGSDWLSGSEDLAQEAFAVAFAKRDQFHRKSSLTTWICGIALNLVRHHLAREAFANRMIRIFSETELVPESAITDDPLLAQVRREHAEMLLSVVEGLPDKLLQAFVMCCIFGVSQEEVAAELGVSEGNLKVRITRARMLIRKRMLQSNIAGDH